MSLKHVLSASQFNKALIDKILQGAGKMESALQKGNVPQKLAGKIVACLFFEPSTRTRLSFETAVLRLGGQLIDMESGSLSSSAFKGESVTDTIKIVSGFADLIVIRHPEDGSAEQAAFVSPVPIINAGDGGNQHPTQSLLDLYTIKKETGRLQNLMVAMVGDLLYGRTIHSTLTMLSLYPNNKFIFVAPKQLKLPQKYKDLLKKRKCGFVETENLSEGLKQADAIYMTRVQKERFASKAEYEKLKLAYVFDKKALRQIKKNAVILHALPRVGEIAEEVDKDPRAAYFRQAKNGLYVRMALLVYALGL
jgi:aspartate carbamoyltransferase catalytic subunit